MSAALRASRTDGWLVWPCECKSGAYSPMRSVSLQQSPDLYYKVNLGTKAFHKNTASCTVLTFCTAIDWHLGLGTRVSLVMLGESVGLTRPGCQTTKPPFQKRGWLVALELAHFKKVSVVLPPSDAPRDPPCLIHVAVRSGGGKQASFRTPSETRSRAPPRRDCLPEGLPKRALTETLFRTPRPANPSLDSLNNSSTHPRQPTRAVQCQTSEAAGSEGLLG